MTINITNGSDKNIQSNGSNSNEKDLEENQNFTFLRMHKDSEYYSVSASESNESDFIYRDSHSNKQTNSDSSEFIESPSKTSVDGHSNEDYTRPYSSYPTSTTFSTYTTSTVSPTRTKYTKTKKHTRYTRKPKTKYATTTSTAKPPRTKYKKTKRPYTTTKKHTRYTRKTRTKTTPTTTSTTSVIPFTTKDYTRTMKYHCFFLFCKSIHNGMLAGTSNITNEQFTS